MLMLIMLMPANTMAASQNFSEFYGAWFAIRPANQKFELFSPQESTTSLTGTTNGGKSSHELSSLFGVNAKFQTLSELNGKSTGKSTPV